jgi:hypothetical protein
MVAVFLVWVPVAQAWSWPVQGPVLQPFVYDEAHPYAAGQHRGIDIGADAAGETVVAPAAGTVSFAGSVPTSGKSVTIQTADGYSVTLTHLGSIVVSKGGTVAEGDSVGTIGPSGTPEFDQPYVHLGIRVTTDPNGYLDPLHVLPAASATAPTQADSEASQPSAGGGSASTPVTASSPQSTIPGSNVQTSRTSVPHPGRSRTSQSRSSGQARTHELSQRPASHPMQAGQRVHRRIRVTHRHLGQSTSTARRPGIETDAPRLPARLDAGHEIRSGASVAARQPRVRSVVVPLPLVLNGLAAVLALAAAIAAARGRRRRVAGNTARVLHLSERRLEQRAA